MGSPAHYLSDQAERNAIEAARKMVAPLLQRIEALEKEVSELKAAKATLKS